MRRARQRSAEEQAGGRLSGYVPLVIVAVIVVMFIRSCFGSLAGWSVLGGGSGGSDRPPRQDILSGGGSDEGAASDEPMTTTTLDADEFYELMEPRDPECPEKDGSSPRHLQWTGPPPMCIDPERTCQATLETSLGDIVVELDTGNAPITSNHFVFLARWHYYDGVEFRRVVRGGYAEAGDPIGWRPPGTPADPGYTVEDELPTDEPYYPTYSVNLSNWGEPDTGNTIFFIVTGWEAQLPPNYSQFGEVVKGRGVVEEIDAAGSRGDDDSDSISTPKDPIVIHRVTIAES